MYLDVLFLFVVLIFALFGYLHGLVRQILSLSALVCILFFAQPLANWLKADSGWDWFQKAPMVALWGLSSLGIILFHLGLGGVIMLMRKTSALSPTDRWLGASLGAVKGLVVCLSVGVLLQVLPEEHRAHFEEFHGDARDSLFMKASASILDWKSLSSIRGLRQIRKNLHDEESRLNSGLPLPPETWSLDPSAEIHRKSAR